MFTALRMPRRFVVTPLPRLAYSELTRSSSLAGPLLHLRPALTEDAQGHLGERLPPVARRVRIIPAAAQLLALTVSCSASPLLAENVYLDPDLRDELFNLHGIKPFTFYQRPGQFVMIPAG